MNQIESNMTELNSTKIGLPRNLTLDQNKPFFKLEFGLLKVHEQLNSVQLGTIET